MLRSVLIAVLLISAVAHAAAVCTLGSGCACTPNTCTCQDQCSFDCSSGSCAFDSPGSVSVTCDENTACSSTIDGGVRFDCEQAASCQLTAGGPVVGSCSRQALCSLSVGAGSDITCSASVTTCAVDCAGDCRCTGARCSLSCASGAQPMFCGDGGVQVCGACPVDGGVVDAGAPDGGSDGGFVDPPVLEPWSLKVGCSSVAMAPLSLALLALLRRRSGK